MRMKTSKTLVIFLCILLAGCAGGWEQVDDAFYLPIHEYDAKWNPDLRWEIEDVHAYVNIEVDDSAVKANIQKMFTKKYQNGLCLYSAERKYELALQHGYNENDLEIVVIKLSEDAALKADWSNGWPTHAVLRYKDTVYDNGFISKTPFDYDELLTPRYGTKVQDVWSRYRK